MLWLLATAQGATPGPVRYNQHIRPIFTNHCTECHGGVKQASELSFIYPQQVLPPDGWVVEPGKPDESVLIERVASDDVEFRMPPAEHGSALSKKEIAVLREWIRQGAEWERPWAFDAPQRQARPSVEDEVWCRFPIDWFILSRLESEELQPNPAASAQCRLLWVNLIFGIVFGMPFAPSLDTGFFLPSCQGECSHGQG
jgi:hypothetical protein